MAVAEASLRTVIVRMSFGLMSVSGLRLGAAEAPETPRPAADTDPLSIGTPSIT